MKYCVTRTGKRSWGTWKTAPPAGQESERDSEMQKMNSGGFAIPNKHKEPGPLPRSTRAVNPMLCTQNRHDAPTATSNDVAGETLAAGARPKGVEKANMSRVPLQRRQTRHEASGGRGCRPSPPVRGDWQRSGHHHGAHVLIRGEIGADNLLQSRSTDPPLTERGIEYQWLLAVVLDCSYSLMDPGTNCRCFSRPVSRHVSLQCSIVGACCAWRAVMAARDPRRSGVTIAEVNMPERPHAGASTASRDPPVRRFIR